MNLLPRNGDDQVHNDNVLNEAELDSGSIAALPAAGLGRRTRRGISLVIGMLVLVLIASSHSWWLPPAQSVWARIFPPPPYTGTLIYAHSGASLYGLRATDGRVQWRTHDINSDTTPIVHGDMIITVSADAQIAHRIVALGASDGHVLWQTVIPAGHTRPVFWQDAGQIYAWYPFDTGPEQPLYEAIDPHNGHVRWSIHIDGEPSYIQQSTDDVLPFCAKDSNPVDRTVSNKIIVVDRQTGAERWRSPPLVTDSGQNSSCYVAGGTILMNAEQPGEAQMTGYDLHTGSQSWQIAYLGRLATVDHDAVYTTTWYVDQPSHTPDTFTAWRATDGQHLWQINGSLTTFIYSPVAHASLLTITPTGLAGLDPHSGTVRWQHTIFAADLTSLQLLYGAGEVIYYADEAHVYALNGATGTINWQTPLSAALQSVTQHQLYVDHHSVYALGATGLTAFDGATGHILWNNTQSFNDLICASCG